LSREDADISTAVAEILQQEDIDIKLEAKVMRIENPASAVVIHFTSLGLAQSVSASHLLVATGRTPNTESLGLDAAGVALDQRGFIVVDDELQTSVPGIYALGDVNGRGAFTHTSYNDFEIVAQNLLDGRKRSLQDRVPAYALYIDPPLGRAGMTEKEVRLRGVPALMATLPMKRVSRARERGEEEGFMKVLVDAQTKHILGAALLGIEADEVIQLLLLAMSARLPYTVIQDTMGIHPTVSELLPTLFAALKPLEPPA
jgi:pyruvate/2-oxoglutarate dehydrogenase complex dihydrolipoamide dehydrogenase (E3) component